jgi:endonuclease/exonuclease/phosphatase family metal-dependent hydrolase
MTRCPSPRPTCTRPGAPGNQAIRAGARAGLTTRRGALAWAAILLLAGCSSTAAPRRAREASPGVTVLSYNIHRGVGLDGRSDLARIAEVLRSSGADLIALQEVDVGTRRSGGVDQAAELGRLTGFEQVFGAAMDYDGGQYGEAVLSRWPIQSSRVHALPHSPEREPRCALEVRVRPVGGELRFVGTHLDHLADATDRIAQVRALDTLLAADELTPTILVGDFNDEPGAQSLSALADTWADVLGPDRSGTFPADHPERAIDHLFVRPAERWNKLSAAVLDEPLASDHRPVRAQLELLP